MTAATPGPSGPNIFSLFSGDGGELYRAKRETFVFSMVGQALIVVVLSYFTSCAIIGKPPLIGKLPLKELPLVFSGVSGGGGGNFEKIAAWHGNLPPASLADPIVPATVIVPKERPKLPMEESVRVDPSVTLPQGGQIGDPMSQFSKVLSNGPGGPGGIGEGCCDGVGPSKGPGVGIGPEGVFPAGKLGVTVPQVIYSPEPSFSDEARKTKQQGVVTLLLVVGADGHPYNIRVGQSLGWGLDEKAIDAVSHWRFKPGTFHGQAVATQIAVEVDFHLY
ncbi:MAG TPA: energy transducer TonB [Candidatus Sulfotelmatobacter sp.]|nr:energy transducer TonB [Candidatus Sulfotelmatobacter sp.]